MAVLVRWEDPATAALVVEAIFTAADVEERSGRPRLARALRLAADQLGDAIEMSAVAVAVPDTVEDLLRG